VPSAGDTLRAAEAAAREEAAREEPARLTTSGSPGAAAALPATAVRAALADYARAIETRDLAELARAHPGMTADQRRAWKTFFAAVDHLRASLAVETLEPRGDSVHARVRGSYEYRNRRPQRAERSDVTFEAMFIRDSAGWRLRRVE